MNRFLRFAPVASAAMLLLVLLPACTPHVAFSAANRNSIRTTSVAHQSAYPKKEQIYIATFAKNMAGALAGLSGALVSLAAAGDDRGLFLAELQANRIDPGLLIGEAFEREYRQAPVVPWKAPPADAQFQFEIERMGLAIRSGFATSLSPFLGIRAKLIRRDGTVLWDYTTFVHETDVRHAAKDYATDPAVMRQAFEIAATALAKEFLEELRRDAE